MFLLRFGVLIVFVIMLLPADRAGGPSSRHASDAGFCTRYPNTCAAGGELWVAFKHKAAYAVTLTRETLAGGSGHRGATGAASSEKLSGRYPDWRSPRPANDLPQDERNVEWRPGSR